MLLYRPLESALTDLERACQDKDYASFKSSYKRCVELLDQVRQQPIHKWFNYEREMEAMELHYRDKFRRLRERIAHHRWSEEMKT